MGSLIGKIGGKSIIGTLGSGQIVLGKNAIPDWNQNDPQAEDYIKNRPGGYDIPSTVDISWDGDMTGKETIQFGRPFQGMVMYMCKITDNTPPIESFYASDDHGDPITKVQVVTGLHRKDGTFEEIVETIPFDDDSTEGYYSASGQNYIFVTSESVTINTRTYSKGIWCYTVTKDDVTTQYVKRITTANNKVSVRFPYSFAPTQVIEAVNTGAKKKDPEFTGTLSLNRLKDSDTGYHSVALGYNVTASGNFSHAEGYYTTAKGYAQHVEGEFNIISGNPKSRGVDQYVHIVGNGTDRNHRSNAYTLSWDGVPWYKGRPKFGGTSMTSSLSQSVMANGDEKIIMKSPTKKFKMTVNDAGVPSFTDTHDDTNKFTPVKDVQVNGASVLNGGVANVPYASTTQHGVVRVGSGVGTSDNGDLYIVDADESVISRRIPNNAITPNYLDYAIKAAMCDGKGAAWTAAEQKAARIRMGADGDYVLIESITLTEETTYFERDSEPDGTPYDLIALKVIVKFVPGQTTGAFCFYGYNGENRITGGASQVISMPDASGVEWYRSTAVADVKPLFGLYDCMISQGSQGAAMNVARAENGYYQLSSTVLHITKFNFHLYAANGPTPCIVGTEIKIYGVRA